MKVKDDYQFKGQITIFDILDQDIWSGKMSQELSAQELPREQTSEQSLKKSLKLLSRKSPIFLSLKRDGPTQDASKEWVMMEFPSALPGDSTMLNTGECPNEERGSHLSQILEVNPPPKYSLSARACQGILNRANRRGKQLPEILEKALIRQSAFKSEQDVQGEVKEFSSNTTEPEHCQPLTTNPSLDKEPILLESNQNHATIQTNGISTSLPASMGEGGGYVPMIVRDDHNPERMPDKNRSNDVITVSHGGFMTNADDSGKAQTLQASDYKDPQIVAFDSYDLRETGDKGRCLTAAGGGINEHVPIVCGVDAFNQNATGDKTMPLTSAATDPNHIPCVYSVDEGAGKSQCGIQEGQSPTLATTHGGEPVVCYGLDRASFNQGKNAKYDFSVEEDKAQTIVSRGPGGVMTSSEVYVQETRKE